MDTNSEAMKATADQEAGHMKSETQKAAGELGGDVKEQARAVTDEATAQAKSLASSLTDEVSEQASAQQGRLAGQSRIISDDLQRVARGEQAESDMVNQFISQAADRAQRITEQLETKEPRELLDDVRSFAARRPGLFFAIAAGVGIAAGRLTRGMRDGDDGSQDGAVRPGSETSGYASEARTDHRSGTMPHLDPSMDYGGETAPGVDPTIEQAARSGGPDPRTMGNAQAPNRGLGESGRYL